jgi:threonine dehydrogenase-like Zn-dependent dehydrogenase
MASQDMVAAVFERVGVLNVKRVPVPRLEKPDQVLIRVRAVSVCGTDVRGLADPPQVQFKPGIVIGHECTGVVQEVGPDVRNVQVGDAVVVHPNLWCGSCHYCRTGQINLCTSFQHVGDSRDGAMAEYLCVPERLVYRISKQVPPHVACLAEPLACVLNGTRSVRVHPGENVVVLGAGPIGLIFMLLYKAAGAHVFVSDVSEKRRSFASSLGADAVFDPTSCDLEKEVLQRTGVGADLVADAVGSLLPEAISLLRKGGQIVLFGLNDKAIVKVPQIQIVFKEARIHGAYITKGTFPQAVDILESGTIPLERLVTHRLPIQEARRGIDLMRDGEGVKVVIELP